MFAKKQVAANVASLLPLVREGSRVAAMNPTCALMMREDPRLVGTEDARTVAAAVADPHELLYELRRKDLFNREFRSTPGSIAYHVPCHLKAQNIGLRSRDLMRLIPQVRVTGVDACCAHDGTWAMKKEYFELSSEAVIAHELDTYNELLPGPNELAATLLIEFTGPAQRDENPRELTGLENHIYLLIGERRQKARVDLRQVSQERVSSVQFVRFALGGVDSEDFAAQAAQGRIAVEITHPAMTMLTPIGVALAAALAQDVSQN